MSLDRAHRLDGEGGKPAEDVDAARPELEVPGRRTELERLLDLSARVTRRAEQTGAPGRQTRVAGARAAKLDFDDHRVLALREVLERLGPGHPLRREVLAAADGDISRRATRSAAVPSDAPLAGGRAMWQAAERHAVTLYRHAADAGEVDGHDPAIAAVLEHRGGGRPLPAELRRELEAELDLSLARVRVHTDAVAAHAARAAHADAFTVGEDIFFADGAFSPEQPAGRKLLVHELAHVAQALRGRTGSSNRGVRVSRPGEALEREADEIAERVERGRAGVSGAWGKPERGALLEEELAALRPGAREVSRFDDFRARGLQQNLARRGGPRRGAAPAGDARRIGSGGRTGGPAGGAHPAAAR